MLLTLGLLLLLTPFPSLQTPTNEKRNSTGSDTAKPNVVLALSKPKTTATLVRQMVKQTTRPTPRPSAVNQTGLTASTANQKPPTLNALKSTKDKPIATVIMGALSPTSRPATASAPKITKNKPAASANQTMPATASAPKITKNKPAASANQTMATKSPTNAKEKPAPAQPIKLVISTDCDTNGTKEQELKLRPGAPLVMTHRISLIPAGCTGGCVAEMAALKGRVARLEKEMTSLKQKCPCSEKCQNDCSGNGKCEKGKCVCLQGFLGPDCSRCAPGANCNKKSTKEKVKLMVETVTLQVNQESNAINAQGKKTKVEQTLFQKKDQRKGTEAKEVDAKTKLITSVKVGVKTSASKPTVKGSSGGTKITRPTVGQVLLKQVGRKHEEARKGKTGVLIGKKLPTASPATFNKTRPGKETLEQSTLAEKNVTQSPAKKVIKKVKAESVNATKVVQSVDNAKSETSRTGSAKGKTVHQSQYLVNVTVAETEVKVSQTSVQSSVNVTRRAGGAGLGSVRVENITSHSFTLTWSAPSGMFKNFTVSRTEHRAEGEEEDEDEEAEEGAFEGDNKVATTAKNATEVQAQSESTNVTAPTSSSSSSSPKAPASRGKAEGKRVSMVLPGGVRSVEFGNLRPLTRYAMTILGTALGKRSKIHRVTVTTGPEPATELLFSNVTESSLTVSWSKPKSTFTGVKVTYTLSNTGESSFVTVLSQQSYVVLSKLSAGTSYTISVTTMQGKVQSDALSSTITTVPAPPTHLQVINITDTRATLQWTPSLGKVDRFIISYESSKTPNVTVTVMVSGNSIEHQLRGLARGTLYIVKVLSQKDSHQSMAISTTFTTASAVKASEVGARSAVIAWKAPTVAFHSYRLTYQVVGEESKEVILEHTITEYKLTGLLSMSRYIVLVQGEREGRYTSVVTTEFITGKLRFPFPTECSQELLNGALQSGEVDIYPGGKEGGAVRVYCDMETEGGGWTVFQRRMNGKLDFFRTWNDYSVGFGNLSEEFWLGNELLHNLTSMGPVSLRVDLVTGKDVAYAHYSNFTIDSEEKHYAIMVSGYTGTAGDSMRYHNGRPFSTRDKDPNPLGIHCARAYMGGWWYKNCYKTNLNGLYGINSNNQGVVWIDWKGKDSSIPFSEMKFRPAGFSPATHG